MARNINRDLRQFVLAVAISLIASAGAVTASGYTSIFRGSGLTPEDVELAHRAAQSLYTKAGVKTGEVAEWSNEKSGSSGRVDVTNVDSANACVTFRHSTLSSNNQQKQVSQRRCRNAEGVWILTP